MALALRFQAAARLGCRSNALRMPLRRYSSAASTDGTLPLAGIRVLDMTRVLAGVSEFPMSLKHRLIGSSHIVLKFWVI